jgi:hypothetical protein
VHEWKKKYSHRNYSLQTVCLLEMYPSFPCRKRGRRRAWFEVLVDCCYCGSIQRDCQLETFSVMRDGRGVWEMENERTSRRKVKHKRREWWYKILELRSSVFALHRSLLLQTFHDQGLFQWLNYFCVLFFEKSKQTFINVVKCSREMSLRFFWVA